MDDFIEVGKIDDLAEGSMKEVVAEGQNILLAHVGDKFYATGNHCPHMGANLSKGRLEDTVVTCPRHGSQFDLEDGKVIRWIKGSGVVSAVGKLVKQPIDLKMYEVKIDGGKILIKI